MSTARLAPSAQPAAVYAPTLCAAFQMTVEEHGDRVALRAPGDEGGITWADYAERVRRVAAALASVGVARGDSFGVMLINRPEFHIADAAAMHLGAAAFSAYTTATADQIAYVVSDAGNRVMVTERAFLGRVLEVQRTVPALEHVIVVDGPADGATSLEALIASGDPVFDLAAAGGVIETDDVLTLIYTSGTTGPPKGVQLTHGNMLATLRGIDQKFPQATGAGRVVSYLPIGTRCRALVHPLRADGDRGHRHVRARSRGGRAGAGRCAPDALPGRSARVGEGEGGARGRDRRGA